MTNLHLVNVRFSVYKEYLDTANWMLIDAEIVGTKEDTRIRFHFLDEDYITDWYIYDDVGIFHEMWADEYAQVKELSYVDQMEPGRPGGVV